MSDALTDLLKGVYPYFFWLALIGIFVRIRKGEWKHVETILLLIYLAFIGIAALQPFLFYGKLEIFRRYLLVGTPLYLGWSAYAAVYFYQRLDFLKKRPEIAYGAAGLILLFLIIDAWMPAVKNFTSSGKSRERVAVLRIAELIRADWRRSDTASPILKCDFYRSPRRPLVQNDLKSLGYLSGGQDYVPGAFAAGAQPDYIISLEAEIPAGYSEIAAISVRGDSYRVWRLKAGKN